MGNELLLLEGYNAALEIDLNESNITKGLLKFKGKLQESGTPNKNKRVYPHQVLDENVQRLLEVVKTRGLLGELDHPENSIIHFKEASHVITKLWWEGNILMGEGEILSTAHGRQLKALMNDGIRVGMSSRGVGNGKVDDNGVLVISDNFRLITFDAVADPSTHSAFQERVISNKRESVINNYESPIKENANYVQKEILLAALAGLCKEQTKKVKNTL